MIEKQQELNNNLLGIKRTNDEGRNVSRQIPRASTKALQNLIKERIEKKQEKSVGNYETPIRSKRGSALLNKNLLDSSGKELFLADPGTQSRNE